MVAMDGKAVKEDFVDMGDDTESEKAKKPKLEWEEAAGVAFYGGNVEEEENQGKEHKAVGVSPDMKRNADK